METSKQRLPDQGGNAETESVPEEKSCRISLRSSRLNAEDAMRAASRAYRQRPVTPFERESARRSRHAAVYGDAFPIRVVPRSFRPFYGEEGPFLSAATRLAVR